MCLMIRSVDVILIFFIAIQNMETNLLSVSYITEIVPGFSYTKINPAASVAQGAYPVCKISDEYKQSQTK